MRSSTSTAGLGERPTLWRPTIALALLAMASLTGCGGCDRESPKAKAKAKLKAELTAEELEKQRKQRERPPFEMGAVTPLLSETIVSAEGGRPLALAKPGHWTTTVQLMRANREDFEGRTTLTPTDGKGRSIGLEHTSFELSSSRPAILAKGRPKRVISEVLVPDQPGQIHVEAELYTKTGGRGAPPQRRQLTLMPSYQYFLLVLAREPARYSFLKLADAVRAPYEDADGIATPHYRVVLADGNSPLPLPPNVLCWTSVAYVVWDEVNLARIDPSQQAALVDWLHWGGRLIINGPDSLAGLRGSFLEPYLPADPGGIRTVTDDDLGPLNAAWTPRPKGGRVDPIAVTRPWSGIELEPRAGAAALPGSDGLFYERAIGAGSVVASAVQLSERDLVNWKGFDGFLNGGLLRRPPRVFSSEREGAWTGLQSDWAEYEGRTHDAHFTTGLRWFTRDLGAKANQRTVGVAPDQQQGTGWGGMPIVESQRVSDRAGGLGGWNEFGPASRRAREALREAAGVRVPGAAFVVVCLAIYLVVLVPLNWMLFQALGRVEWAWAAAPVIAVLGAAAIVRLAQLDIGFVRAQTEIAVLELHGGYPRGHLTRYTALYSSLATTYDIEFDDATAVATPFPRDESFNPSFGDAIATVALEKYDRPRLRGVATSSASTEFVHSEQMYALAGPVRMSHPTGSPNLWQLENRGGFDLYDAVVVHRRFTSAGPPSYQGCWLGHVRNGSSVLMPWTPLKLDREALPFAAERRRSAVEDKIHKRLEVDELLKLAFRFPSSGDPLHGNRDEYRLVARLDESLPGLSTAPSASQAAATTIILAHLDTGLAPPPKADWNTPRDVGDDGEREQWEEEAGN